MIQFHTITKLKSRDFKNWQRQRSKCITQHQLQAKAEILKEQIIKILKNRVKFQLSRRLTSIFYHPTYQSTCMLATLDQQLSEKLFAEFSSSWVTMSSGSTTSETGELSSGCSFLTLAKLTQTSSKIDQTFQTSTDSTKKLKRDSIVK